MTPPVTLTPPDALWHPWEATCPACPTGTERVFRTWLAACEWANRHEGEHRGHQVRLHGRESLKVSRRGVDGRQ